MTRKKGFGLIALGLSSFMGSGWGASLSPELIVRRCDVIGVGTLEGVTDAWSIVPLKSWYPNMKDDKEYLVIGLAKFHLKTCLKGADRVKSGFLRAAFPVMGYKAGAAKHSSFTMTDFRPLNPSEIGSEALWCFQWDEASQGYVVRFDYQRQSPSQAKVLEGLMEGKTWTIPERSPAVAWHAGILEGTMKSLDLSKGTMSVSQPQGNGAADMPRELRLPAWLTDAGSEQLSASDLVVGDAVRAVACEPSPEGPLTVDHLELISHKPYASQREVLRDAKAPKTEGSRAASRRAGAGDPETDPEKE